MTLVVVDKVCEIILVYLQGTVLLLLIINSLPALLKTENKDMYTSEFKV